MTDEELQDALDGLFAYHNGCADSGIKDEPLRQRVVEEINKDIGEHQLFSSRLSRLARELYLTDERIAQGYGLEDIKQFAEWVDDFMRATTAPQTPSADPPA